MGSCLSRPRRPPPPSRTHDNLLALPVEQYLEQAIDVFQNDLLLDLILTRALLKPMEDGTENAPFSTAEARGLRQVCHRWMFAVSSLFLRTRQSLLSLEVTDTQPERLESLMEGFERSTLYTTESTSGRRSSLPPFSLSLDEAPCSLGWFLGRWIGPFYPLMVRFGGTSSMVQLRICDKFFSKHRPPQLPSNLLFSTLQKLTLEYGNYFQFDGSSNDPLHVFIQTILDRSLELREFSYELGKVRRSLFAQGLIFPQTLTHLQITTVERSSRVARLDLIQVRIISPLQPPLSQLTSLKVQNMCAEYRRDLFKLVWGVRLTLEHLLLEHPWNKNEFLEVMLVDYPVLPKLKTFILQGQLILNISETETVQEAKCPAVQSLTIPLVQYNLFRFGEWTPIPLDTVILIRSNFSSVAHMNIMISWGSLHGLTNLFLVMGDQLRVLNVKFEDYYAIYNDLPPVRFLKYNLEAVLLGTTPEMVMRYGWLPSKFRRIVSKEDCVQRSIRNLKNLEHLSVTGKCSQLVTNKSGSGLVSSLCFRLAFLKMPQLKHLTMGGSFQVSKKSVRLWEKTGGGRTIDNEH